MAKRSKAQTETLTDLFAEQQHNLLLLRSALTTECPDLTIPEDLWLVRYLIFTTVHKAIPRVKELLQWRKAHNVDQIAARIEEENLSPKDFPHADVMARCCPQTVLFGYAKDGTPFGFEAGGQHDFASLLYTLTFEQYHEFHLYKFEYIRLLIHKMSQQSGKLVRYHVITDLDGLGMRHANTSFFRWFRIVCTDSQNFYREMVQRVFCPHSNSVFCFVWRMLKPLLSERSAQKVLPLQSDFAELFEVFDSSQLPKLIGGDLANNHFLDFDMKRI
eukprot:c18670_g1_i1.p1 GENE.c18670_g1_i1~~c18670_g1_i1.p1  ORF type:complete len:293 (-),score=68.86 c18670_g1_i1:271-1092(-)